MNDSNISHMNDNSISHQKFTVVAPCSKNAHSAHWLFLIYFFYNLNEYFRDVSEFSSINRANAAVIRGN